MFQNVITLGKIFRTFSRWLFLWCAETHTEHSNRTHTSLPLGSHVDQSETSVCLVEQPIRIVPVGKTFTCSGLVCIRSWKSIVTVLIRERLNKIIEFIQKVSRFEFENWLNYLQVLSSKLFSMKFSRIKPKLAHILRFF